MSVHEPLAQLLAIEAIKQVKYAYMRHLDLKEWQALAELLTEDVVSSYSDGKYCYQGREQVLDFLRQSLNDPAIITLHHVHHPEIALAADGVSASGVWYLEDRVINRTAAQPEKHFDIVGASFYQDQYRLTEDGWKIAATGYQRVFEQLHVGGRELSLKSRFVGSFS